MSEALGPLADESAHPECFYGGYRLVGVDGTQFSVLNTPAILAELPKAAARRFKAAFAKLRLVTLVEYTQLQEQSNQLAGYLRALGVGAEVVVGLCIERGLDLAVSLLAILKAGGAYLPLDPDYPAERLAFMVRDSGASLVLTQSHLRHRVQELQLSVLCIEAHAAEIACQPRTAPPVSVCSGNLAYVMYTSGSTGSPKAIAVTHSCVSRLVMNTNYVDVQPDDVFLQLAPLSFDASTFEIWAPLLNGARLLMYPPGPVDLAQLAEVIQTEKVSVLWLTAGLFAQMVDEFGTALSGLRLLLAGGDVISVAHVRRLLEEGGRCELINGYGPTEGTTFSVCYRVRDPRELGATIPIGRPVANTRIYVLDDNLEPVPPGIFGELYIGGEGLARGHFGRPGMTASRFVAGPFAAGERLYRTGDRVRYRADGNVEYLERIDQQVKIRGYRTEPGEIEMALLDHARVKQAAVVMRSGERGDKSLVAYVVASTEERLDTAQLRDHLRQRMPEYMVPARFVALHSLPLTANGKVDRNQLPAARDNQASSDYVAPETEVEQAVARIWREVLDLERVGVHDDFFELGGHSLQATRIISRIRHGLAVDIGLREFLRTPTVLGLAERIDSLRQQTTETDLLWQQRMRESLQSDISRMSDEEVAAMLQQIEATGHRLH